MCKGVEMGGKPSPGRKLKRISVSLTTDQYIGLEEMSDDRGISLSDAAREAINTYLLTEHWGATVGKVAEAEIANGLTNKEVLEKVLATFPAAKTSRESIAWYRSMMRKSRDDIPTDREAAEKRGTA